MKSYAFLKDASFKTVTLVDHTVEQFVERNGLKEEDLVPINGGEIDVNFFGAYTIKSKKITLDIKKAKEIKTDRLRKDREAVLERLDKKSIAALENNDSVAIESIKSEKQKLRDFPSKVSAMAFKGLSDLEDIHITDFYTEV